MKFITNFFIYFYRIVSFIFRNFIRGICKTVYAIFHTLWVIIYSISKYLYLGEKQLFSIFKIKKNDKKKSKNTNIVNKNEKKDELQKYIDKRKKKEKIKEEKLKAKKDIKEKGNFFERKFNNSRIVKDYKNRKELKRQVLLIDFESKDVEKSEKKQTYIYEAKSPDGKFIKGKFDAFSKVDVHSFLLNEGYEVYDIKTSKMINFLYGSSFISKDKYSKKELIFFLTQLSTYLRSGIPLIDAIRIFAKQEKKESKRKILQSVIYELIMGESFSNALDKQGNAFPKLLINMIKTAEMTGELPDTLDDMGTYYESAEKTRKQMISAMTYPSIVFIMAIAIITFIMLFVIPQFVDIYNDIDAEMPEITLFVIGVSDFLGKYWMFVFGGIALFVILFIFLYRKIKLFRTAIQYIIMHIPVIGKIIIYNEVTMFTKTFGSLLNHNVFITDSMEILSKITNNEIYKMIVFDTITNLAKGESISTSFKDHWAFPVVAYEMILTGERTGELGKMMEKVSNFYQEQHANLVTQMKSFIEPIMISVLALIVGGLLLAVVIPMFSLYNQI